MAKFYGTIEGIAKNNATGRGNKNIKVSAQSYDGSVITILNYNKDNELIINIELNDDSDVHGKSELPSFHGTLEQLMECFTNYRKEKMQ